MTTATARGRNAEGTVMRDLRAWWGGEWSRTGLGKPGKDLIEPADFPFAVEVKAKKGVTAHHFFQPTKQLIGWWQQAKDQAGEKEPLLIVKSETSWYWVCRWKAFGQTALKPPPAWTYAIWTGTDIVFVARLSQMLAANERRTDNG